MTTTEKQTLGFQTEVRQLLDLMIHSLYSDKDIFLRELISNASDAVDKLRFEALRDESLYEGDSDLKIGVQVDRASRTITITDNGIGMTRDEVIENIGTIASSGTRRFFERLTGDEAKDARLIGQFGVGFYSAFMVADRVTLLTRRAKTPAADGVAWESAGTGEYTVETVERAQRGTTVVLHLREGEDEFLDDHRLKAIIRRYSDHITLPIVMPGADGTQETVNKAAALWARPRHEITELEYDEFYKHVAHDFEAPLAHIHSRVEGKQEYTVLLFVPRRAPFDLFDRDRRYGVKLYVRRVFIMDDAEQLLPNYLRFMRGVIDAADLPLNVSREILQKSRDIDTIRSGATRKVLDLLAELAEKEAEKYRTFWTEFGVVLKEGVVEDAGNRERIAKLLRFQTTAEAGDGVSLGDYVARMVEGQNKIYYVTAESAAAARQSPHLEIFRRKGIEVLLLTDRIDEWLVTHLSEFEGHALQSVAKGDLDLKGVGRDEDGPAMPEVEEPEWKAFTDRMARALGDKVKEVRVSRRLTESPACLVAGEHDLGIHLERLLKAAGQNTPASRPVLEINPGHALITRLRAESSDERFADWTQVLFDQAILAEGGTLENGADFVHRLNGLLLSLQGA
ncbi:molecular chaperone HtpG [Acidiferrobacter sp.]|uniref:molecular chaperone HtpG n=1 Tax=Acidiferrobacter sp. TaxID=1872107 RepID=UPI00261142BB|nr:molecular chaperone HtpG [Acidiferrobacter sp.]